MRHVKKALLEHAVTDTYIEKPKTKEWKNQNK